MRAKWEAFWANQTSPLHGSDSPVHYERYGAELRLVLPERPLRRVLEIGCGDGALFAPLGFNKDDYTGIDFSLSMLAAFATRHPGVRLIRASGDEYTDSGGYDLIFSNGVIQYFGPAMLDRWLNHARRMLTRDGAIVIGSIPWRRQLLGYCSGEFSGGRLDVWHTLRGLGSQLIKRRMGRWYSFRQIERAAKPYGLSSELFGSVLYPYRFHVRMLIAACVNAVVAHGFDVVTDIFVMYSTA